MAQPTKSKAIERLKKVLDEIPDLKKLRLGSQQYQVWYTKTETALIKTFDGEESRHVKDFNDIFFPRGEGSDTTDSDRQRSYIGNLESAEAVLLAAINEIEEYWEDEQVETSSQPNKNDSPKGKPKVFIIHGHDEAAKESLARCLEKLGLEAIILHEQPNRGKTIIEKFENAATDVEYAIALLTPDDLAYNKGDKKNIKPRARQNVIFELGYFCGLLGRKKVCMLYKEGVETPSDYNGVVYTVMDDGGAWKLNLAKEMKQAGLNIDLNNAI